MKHSENEQKKKLRSNWSDSSFSNFYFFSKKLCITIFFTKLDYTGQTDGTITADSDVWLFGAKIVYKSFFGQDPYIDSYSSEIIKSQLGKLI